MHPEYSNPLESLSFDVSIPSALLLSCIQSKSIEDPKQRLEPNCVVFYAILKGLARVKGYCWAKNSYLAGVMQCDLSTVEEYLMHLENYGWISRKTKKKGMFWDRKIYVTVDQSKNKKIKEMFAKLEKKGLDPGKKRGRPRGQPYIEDKGYKDNNQPSAVASALCDFFIEEIRKKKPNFTKKIIPKDWFMAADKLLRERKREDIDKIINFAINHDFWFANVLSIPSLLKHLDKLEIQMAQKPSKSSINKNVEFAKNMEMIYPEMLTTGELSILEDSIKFRRLFKGEFVFKEIRYTESAFEEQVKNELRHHGAPMERLEQ